MVAWGKLGQGAKTKRREADLPRRIEKACDRVRDDRVRLRRGLGCYCGTASK
jgi:hypothetical protein